MQFQMPLPGLQPEVSPEGDSAGLYGPDHIGETKIYYTKAREILTRATGFMGEYDYTLNPYSGCFFGCTYCYAAFFSRNLAKRDDWGNWLFVKENAVDLLMKRKSGSLDGKFIYMSSVTDPYQPVERELHITRGLLQAMVERKDKPKLVIQTRSPDVAADCGLFRAIEDNGGRVQVNMTTTTDDEDIRRTFEPSCPSNSVRLSAITDVQVAGIQSCITMTPLLLVSNPETFARNLCDTRVRNFIVQPFHFQKGKFVANTRDQAFDLMAEKLGCARASFQTQYMMHYRDVRDVLKAELPSLGEGKDGFAPPF